MRQELRRLQSKMWTYKYKFYVFSYNSKNLDWSLHMPGPWDEKKEANLVR